ncbi:MAG: mucoidy inhibitor MuiA family protein [Desulfuromonadales bacterium]|nr:mucoidy inhibitor MuiA family protein [Desulfuromonadales bacterium]
MIRNSLLCLLLLHLFIIPNRSWSAPAVYPNSAASTAGVVIYPDRAMLKKSLPVTVSKGENILELTGLTPGIIDDSVQAGIRSAGKVRIVDIEVRRTALLKADQDRTKEVQARIDKVDQELVRQGNLLTVQKNSLAFLQKIIPFSQDQNTPFPTVRDYLLAMEQTMTDRLGKIAELERSMADLNKKKADLEMEKRNLGPGREESKSILVTVFADAATSFNLDYSYFLSAVEWMPKYEVRADSLSQRLELNFFAIVKQASGEDFSGSNIEISTARPAISGELPELAPWRLDIYKPPVYQSYGRAKMLEMSEAPQAAMLAAAPFDDMALPESRSEATSTSYLLTQKIVLPSDNQPHKILISSSSAEGKFEYLAIPKLAQYASLTAELKNPFVFPLAEGELNIFLDGRFVSTRTVEKPILAGDDMRLTLGRDETIFVSSKLQRQFTERIGAFSKKIRKHYEYEAEIVNGKSRPITLLVREQVPVSAHEEIKVEIISPTPREAEIGSDGILTWTLTLAPGEKRQLSTIFAVSYPENQEITGL